MIRILLTLLLALAACDDVGPMQVDFGFKTNAAGQLERPVYAPYALAPSDELPIEEAASWWNAQVGRDVLLAGQPLDDFTAEIGYVPCDDLEVCPDGRAEVETSVSDGAILSCHITVSSDIAYDEGTVLQVLKHELGECLGLADDCGPPACVDLRSIMSSPLDPLGELTDHDRDLLLEVLDEN